jgi:hypothetical protein
MIQKYSVALHARAVDRPEQCIWPVWFMPKFAIPNFWQTVAKFSKNMSL